MKKLSTLLFILGVLCEVVVSQAIHVVNSSNDNDDGVCNSFHCSLREALNAANTNIGPDSIEFNIPGPGPHTITVNSLLPGILDADLVIDGTTQPGNFPMAGLIIIDGITLPPGPNHGLVIYRRRTEIYGLQVQNFPADGIQLFGGFMGEPDYLSHIAIGIPNKGNVIIANGGYGIEGPIDSNVTVQGNYVGTDLQFNTGQGNAWDGVFFNIWSGSNVRIGGSRTLNQQNYLCSNLYTGLHINVDGGAQFLPGFSLTGNVIGTDDTGVQNLGNLGFGFGGIQAAGGISVLGDGAVTIGGPGGLANIIAFNYSGFYTNTFDQKTVLENFFYCNSNKGIFLDNNANAGILPPAILCFQGNTLVGDAPPGMMIDVYLHNNSVCPNAPCQGLTLLGRVTADVNGTWTFDTSPWPGSQFTAIAQDAMGNSSEFAACILDPNVIAWNGGPYCFGDTIFLFSALDTAVGNVTFEWYGPFNYSSSDQNPVDATEPGIYMVIADIMGCGTDTAFTEVVFYPLASDTITDICFGDSVIVNGTIYDESNTFGEELLVGAAQNGCDSLVVIDLDFNVSIVGRILSTRPRACSGDSVGYWFDLVGGNGPYDVIYTTGIGVPDTLFGIYDGFGDTLVVTSDVHFEILDIIAVETICEPTILTSDSIMVSALSMSPLVTDYLGYGVSCFGENDGMIMLNVTGGVGLVTYDWNIAALNGDVATQLTAGTYSVTISDGVGCDLFFDTLVTQPPMFESITHTDPSTCPGVDDGVIYIDAVLGARGTVEYSLNGGAFMPVGLLPLEIPNLAPGVIDLVLMDSAGCTDDLSVFLPLGETPSIDLGTERSILSGDSILLDFSSTLSPETIQWNPSSVLSCPTCPQTFAFPEQSVFITLMLEDSAGCTATDSILILVFVPKKVFIPNVFSPNGDQINDVFYLQAGDFAVEIEYMIISDVWGDVLHERRNFPINDASFGWDGTFNGKAMNPGVFTYLTRIRFIDGEVIPYSGTVTLIR